MNPNKITAIVLAAGLSSRMEGKLKLSLPYLSSTILEQVVKNIQATTVDEILIITGHYQQEVKRILNSIKSLRFVHNPMYASGMTSSIQCGIQYSKSDSAGFLICQSDMPLISSEEYQYIIDTFHTESTENKIIRPYYKNRAGNPVLFSNQFKEAILKHEEKEGCKKIIQQNEKYVHKVDMKKNHCLIDIDTPQNYKDLIENKL